MRSTGRNQTKSPLRQLLWDIVIYASALEATLVVVKSPGSLGWGQIWENASESGLSIQDA